MTETASEAGEIRNRIDELFDQIVEPKLKWSLNALGLVRSIDVTSEGRAKILINLITDDLDEKTDLENQIRSSFKALSLLDPDLTFGRVNVASRGVEGVKKVLFVGSGKGGVGKSSIASNLAAGLSQQGARVGLMDADIYGPSVPQIMGNHGRPQVLPNEYLMPSVAHGIKLMSVGLLIPDGAAVEWRGVIAAGTLLQFIRKTLWGTLDYLIVDLPPGAGDIHQTLAHELKADGVVIVTTPQELVLGDVRRSIDLFQKCQIPILGIVENMSYLTCRQCGCRNEPFPASDSGLSRELPVLAVLPLSRDLAVGGDKGMPAILSTQTETALKTELDMMISNLCGLIDHQER